MTAGSKVVFLFFYFYLPPEESRSYVKTMTS